MSDPVTATARPRWEEHRDRARRFVKKWDGETRERAEKDSFWNDLLDVFGVDRRQVARFEAVAKRYSTGRTGFIDLFWPGRVLAEHKTAGKSLDDALAQALDYLPGMDPEDVPPVIVACDFREFIVRDLDTGETHRFRSRRCRTGWRSSGCLRAGTAAVMTATRTSTSQPPGCWPPSTTCSGPTATPITSAGRC